MSSPRGRKHKLVDGGILSPIENEPSTKRPRTLPRNPLTRPSVTALREDRTELRPPEQIRSGKRKREREVDPEPEVANDENQFTDLEESLKRLRIRRPIIFSITSFVEQNVDSVTYNLTDQEPELVTSAE